MRRLIIIGAGEGGPQALLALFRRLGPCTDPIIIIQRHLTQRLIAQLGATIAGILGSSCHEATDGEEIVPGMIRLAPAGTQLLITKFNSRYRIQLSASGPISASQPLIDPTLESAARLCPSILAVILGGKGRDGSDGAEAVLAAGGRVLVQDPIPLSYSEMPANALRMNPGVRTCKIGELALAFADSSALQITRQSAPAQNGSHGWSQLIAIGASTGGPAALLAFFDALPRTFFQPIVIVQHIPAGFPRRLGESIGDATGWKITEISQPVHLQARQILIAPGHRHISIDRVGTAYIVAANANAPVNGNRPSVDVLFNSAAAALRGSVVGVMLTGTGNDGLAGARQIVTHGGTVLAQDRGSSAAWGMPGAVVEAGLTTVVKPPAGVATYIARVEPVFSSRPPTNAQLQCAAL